MKKIFTAIILFALALTASAQTFSADQLEKYAKDKYGDNWTKAADNLHQEVAPDFDYASPILDFSIFRGQNRHFCPRLVSFEHQTRA